MRINLHLLQALSFWSNLKSNTYANEASFESKPFKLHKLDQGPAKVATVTKDEAIQYYTQMHTIRRMEAAAGSLYKEKIIRGFCHLYSGQVSILKKFK